MQIFKFIVHILDSIRFLPHVLIFVLCRDQIIEEDIRVWAKNQGIQMGRIKCFLSFIRKYKEFRTLFYYRIPWASVFKFIAPGQECLFIHTNNIGKGLFIQHGFSTIINAKSIGDFCWINQQVTIGYTVKGNPVIGNNVRIGAGAIVIGNITIGDNSIIGAGTTVTTDIPANSLIVGAKPRILINEYCGTTISETRDEDHL